MLCTLMADGPFAGNHHFLYIGIGETFDISYGPKDDIEEICIYKVSDERVGTAYVSHLLVTKVKTAIKKTEDQSPINSQSDLWWSGNSSDLFWAGNLTDPFF